MGYTPPYQQVGKQVGLLVFGAPDYADGFNMADHHYLILPVNPDITTADNVRTTPTQTIQGVYTDNFGLGVGQLQVSGHTGWQVGVGQYMGAPVDGFAAMQALQYGIWNYYFALQQTQAISNSQVTFQWFNDIDEQFFSLQPTGTLSITRHKSTPFLYWFDMSFTILRDIGHGNAPTTPIPDPIDPTISTTQGVPGLRNPANSPSNQGSPPSTIAVTVKSGDTLSGLCQPYVPGGMSLAAFVAEVAQLNHIPNANLIYPGEIIRIPT